MTHPVYFDHNATTPLDPAVFEAMRPWLAENFGNASSRHSYGRAARRAIDLAREQVAAAAGAHPTEVVFVSGGSEANNLFFKGAESLAAPGAILACGGEHASVLEPAKQIARRGRRLVELPVDAAGRADAGALEENLRRTRWSDSKLVSVMLANSETGVLQDVPALARLAAERGAIFHTDGVQALGKIAVDFRALNAAGVGALSVSAHKLGGPKGAGALIVDKRIGLEPLIAGGGQERGLRSGTENVAAIVGFGAACERIAGRLPERTAQLLPLRQRLEEGVRALGAAVFGGEAPRLPNTVYFAFPGIDGETLVGKLDEAGYALSSGSACSSAHAGPSRTLTAMGVEETLARGALRASLGAGNTAEEVEGFLAALAGALGKLRQLAAVAAGT
ncbi:MAG: cysteine desulfurase [Candidatus Accumulibacter sp.]|jgi:cysteine desulfurase|nr:cysteine desulfurase [Accumulibacter sp.]